MQGLNCSPICADRKNSAKTISAAVICRAIQVCAGQNHASSRRNSIAVGVVSSILSRGGTEIIKRRKAGAVGIYFKNRAVTCSAVQSHCPVQCSSRQKQSALRIASAPL